MSGPGGGRSTTPSPPCPRAGRPSGRGPWARRSDARRRARRRRRNARSARRCCGPTGGPSPSWTAGGPSRRPTGPRWPTRSLPGMTGPILAWLARHEPAVVAQGGGRAAAQGRPPGHSLPSPDAVTDRSDASATLLWDVVDEGWSAAAVAAGGRPGAAPAGPARRPRSSGRRHCAWARCRSSSAARTPRWHCSPPAPPGGAGQPRYRRPAAPPGLGAAPGRRAGRARLRRRGRRLVRDGGPAERRFRVGVGARRAGADLGRAVRGRDNGAARRRGSGVPTVPGR